MAHRLAPYATHAVWFPILFLVIFGISRLPSIHSDTELNVDESLWMSQAMRYEKDLMPWRSVDTTTSGPLNSWPFFLLRKAIGPPSYSTVHFASFLLFALSALLVWRSLLHVYPQKTAAFGAWMFGLYLILDSGVALGHFSSEVIPTLILSLALWFLTRGLHSAKSRAWCWPMAAFLAGSCPWAKLQTAPISLAFFLGLCWMIWTDFRMPAGVSAKLRRIALIAISFAVPTFLLLAIVIQAGAWTDFWLSYIARNLSYAEGKGGLLSLGHRVLFFWYHIIHIRQISLLIVGITLFAAFWWRRRFPGFRNGRPEHRALLVFVVLYWLAALYSVAKPQFMFTHHFVLLALPSGLLVSAVAGLWSSVEERQGEAIQSPANTLRLPWILGAVFGLQMLALPKAIHSWDILWKPRDLGDVFGYSLPPHVRSLAPHAHALGIWGWMSYLNVATDIMPASRHAICHFVISPSPIRDHFRQTYLEDIKRSRPEIFVDAVTPLAMSWRDWTKADRIESFPELEQFIRQNYDLVETVPVNSAKPPYRIYLLKGSSAHQPPANPAPVDGN